MTKPVGSWTRSWVVAAVGLVLLLMAASPASFGADDQPLAVADCQVAGSTVTVTVANPGTDVQSGTLKVATQVDGQLVVSQASVAVSGHGTVAVSFGFSSTADQVIALGITDESHPYF